MLWRLWTLFGQRPIRIQFDKSGALWYAMLSNMVHRGQKGPWPGCGVYAQLVIKVQRVPRKYLPHNYTNLNHTYWQEESTCSCCLHQNSEQLNATAETHQTRQWFSSLLLSNFGEFVLIVATVFHLQLTGMTPSVVLCCFKVQHVGHSKMVLCIPQL